MNRAVTLIAEKRANPGKGRRFGADPGKVLGEHPDKGGSITVKKGRYGPYVSHDGVNATLIGDVTPENVTVEQAVGLLEARIAKGGGKKTAKKAAAKKTEKQPAKRPRQSARPSAATASPEAPSKHQATRQAARQTARQSGGQAEEACRAQAGAQGDRGGVTCLPPPARGRSIVVARDDNRVGVNRRCNDPLPDPPPFRGREREASAKPVASTLLRHYI